MKFTIYDLRFTMAVRLLLALFILHSSFFICLAYPPAPATQSQVNTGTEPYLYVTPATLAAKLAASGTTPDPLTIGTVNVTGNLTGNGFGLSQSNGIYLYQGGTNKFIGSAVADLLATVNTNAVAGAVVKIVGGSYDIGRTPVKPVIGITLVGEGCPVIYSTNTVAADGRNMRILTPTSGLKTMGGIVWSNGPISSATLTANNTGCRVIASEQTDPAWTNVWLQNDILYGLFDTAQLNTTNGACFGKADNLLAFTRYDIFGFISTAASGGGGAFEFNYPRFIHSNMVITATAQTAVSLVSGWNITINNGYVHRESNFGTNVPITTRTFSSARGGLMAIFNTIIDGVDQTNSYAAQNDFNQDSRLRTLKAEDFYISGDNGDTNIVFSNVSRTDGLPLVINCNLNRARNLSANPVLVAKFDSGANTNGNISLNLFPRDLAATYRITVFQDCTTAGSAGTLHSAITWTDGSDTDRTISPASDIVLSSTANFSSGVSIIKESSLDIANSTQFWMNLATTVTGATGNPKYQIIVTVEQIGAQ